MVQRLAARTGRTDENIELFFDGFLTDIIGQTLRTYGAILRLVFTHALAAHQTIVAAHVGAPEEPRAADCKARRMISSVDSAASPTDFTSRVASAGL